MDTKEKLQHKLISVLKHLGNLLFSKWDILLTGWLFFCLICGGVWYCTRWISPEEADVRQMIADTAALWLGCNESEGTHQQIVDLYNTMEPSPRNYKVSYEDNWCATFGSAAALKVGFTDIIPMECSCEQQINLFRELGCWQEDECYLPRTGDYIYYVWDEWRSGDCTAWADHVGMVAETFGPVIKVIEGNKDDQVGCRYIFLNDICIRGFGLPDYASKAE